MGSLADGFAARAGRIPIHGLGLSVDVFSPDLLELQRVLERAGSPPEYLEVFKAPARDLACVRTALPGISLAYHAEGLWLIDPAAPSAAPWAGAVDTIARHADALGARWANHECAAKQFSGYSFGTYLPPLFTAAAATAAGENAARAQECIDEWYARCGKLDAAPLLLLELPPLTYFGFGDLPASEFFARVAERTSCGLVLDVGHLWTHWRYRERLRFPSMETFVADFLATFPMGRVVQIHVAGLGTYENEDASGELPFWIDRHDAPVPDVLFDFLRQILAHPELTALKGLALEVDTKAVPAVVEEFGRFREEFAGHARFATSPLPSSTKGEGFLSTPSPLKREEGGEGELARLYEAYARVVSGREPPATSSLAPLAGGMDAEGLARYTGRYLPHELLCWGGDLAELFPSIWRTLERRGVAGADFVRFWFRRPCPVIDQYDFFYVKLDRWVEFVCEVAPDLAEQARRETGALRALHADLNDEPAVLEHRT